MHEWDHGSVVEQYVYLLGLYLGDGSLSFNGRSYQLRVTLDTRHENIVAAATTAVRVVVPHGRVYQRPRGGATIIESGWKAWPELFPHTVPERSMREQLPWPDGREPWSMSIRESCFAA